MKKSLEKLKDIFEEKTNCYTMQYNNTINCLCGLKIKNSKTCSKYVCVESNGEDFMQATPEDFINILCNECVLLKK